jgi:hypothetical protein
MNIATGIKGIKKFLAETAKQTGWHITTETQHLGYIQWDAIEIIKMMSDNGYTFLGATGNGLCFTTN